jgi:hypothetical protein
MKRFKQGLPQAMPGVGRSNRKSGLTTGSSSESPSSIRTARLTIS